MEELGPGRGTGRGHTPPCFPGVQCWVGVTESVDLHFCLPSRRIVEWLALEGISGIIKLQPPCGCQPPHLILDQDAQGPIQPVLEHLQGRGILFWFRTTLSVKNFPLKSSRDEVAPGFSCIVKDASE